MKMDRRTALCLLAAGVLSRRLSQAQQHLHHLTKSPEKYRLQFFTHAEDAIVDRVAEMILPAGPRSGGAHDARVSFFIDLVVANSPKAEQAKWRAALAGFRAAAQRRFGGEFTSLNQKQQASLLDESAAKEPQPVEPPEVFFAEMKKLTIFAYYSSEIGLLKELGYKGNQVLSDYPGCMAPFRVG
jgi:hypothetical protein